MRRILEFLFTAIVFLLTGCIYDYDVGRTEYKPQVVINSIINPDSTIKANLFWSKETDSEGEGYTKVGDFSAKIYENGSLIFEGDNLKDSIKTNYKPKEGASYRLEIEVPEYYGIVSAETSIPQAPTTEIKYSIDTSYNYWNNDCHFEISRISPNSEVRAIIVQTMGLYDNGEVKKSDYLYNNNPFCDQINAAYDGVIATDTYYQYFIRIPYKNLELATPLNFYIDGFRSISINGPLIGYDKWGYPIYDDTHIKPVSIILEVIAPSDDYDQYYKSIWQQWTFSEPGPFNTAVPIYSNVENGLGIFAGYSNDSFKVDIEQDEK